MFKIPQKNLICIATKLRKWVSFKRVINQFEYKFLLLAMQLLFLLTSPRVDAFLLSEECALKNILWAADIPQDTSIL